MMNDKMIAVIGSLGHVGFPFSLVVANAGYKVVGLDLNSEKVQEFNNTHNPPYLEKGAEAVIKYLERTNNVPFMTTELSNVAHSDVMVVMIGTPVDAEGNPRTDDIFEFFTNWYKLYPHSLRDKLIVLRSTVSPGTTEVLIQKIEDMSGLKEGEDFFLVFAPERVAQGNSIEETVKFPTLVGASCEKSFYEAENFFSKFTPVCTWLSPTEAELAKLMTNMWRYITFALANEYKMIADNYKCDAFSIINAANLQYPRNNIPLPGPNTGGACLTKDGKFLVNDFPGTELIKSAFEINEGMPAYIISRLYKIGIIPKKVLILGKAFKANCDDTRLSLSFKLKKLLENKGVEVTMYDSVIDSNHIPDISDIDTFIVMTPHDNLDVDYIFENAKLGSHFVDFWHQYSKSDVIEMLKPIER